MYSTYKLLSMQQPKPVECRVISTPQSLVDLAFELSWLQGYTLALDYETTGLDVPTGDRPVGLGLSDGARALYIPLSADMPEDVKVALYDWLQTRKLVGFNVPFDGMVYKHETGRHADWTMDAAAMFRYLATEDWTGQRWDLKTAMVEVLGWNEPNTIELDAWLKIHKLTKSNMSKAPAEILGKYCCLDAAATFHLYEYFLTFRQRFVNLFDYHENEGLALARQIIDQQLTGLTIDRERLVAYQQELQQSLAQLADQFYTHPLVYPWMQTYDDWVTVQHFDCEPPKHTKLGTVTKRWWNWAAKEESILYNQHFNLRSNKQLIWLFYEHMYEVSGDWVVVDGQRHPLGKTKGGAPSIDKNMLPYLGEPGRLLLQYNDIDTELGFIATCLELLADRGRIFPSLKYPGTSSGRASGGNRK